MQYVAKFIDKSGTNHIRKFYAVHVTQANRKALGIAKSNGWILASVGQI